ncbi:MAG: sugar ABC transporter permease [Bacteroidota bacterium]
MTRSALTFRQSLDGYAFISPWLIGFLVFTAGPMIASFVISLHSWSMLSPPSWVGLENYQSIITEDPLFPISLWNTGFYVALSVPLTIAVGLALAILLHNKLPGMSFFRTMVFLPSIMNIIAVSVLWLWIFNPEFGLLNSFLRWGGIDGPLWLQSETWAKPSLVVMSLWGVGGTTIIFLAALQGIPPELHEAAELDGAGPARRFFHITIPMISPAIFFSSIMGVIGSFQVFAQVFVMTGGAQSGSEGGPNNATLFLVLYLYKKAFQEFRMGYASALAWILFFIILAFTVLQTRLSKSRVYYESHR